MLIRSNSLTEQINLKNDILLSQINKIKKIHIKKLVNSPNKLPTINKTKYFRQNTVQSLLNNNNETTNTSNNLKSNISNRIRIPTLKFSNKKVGVQTEQTKKIFPLPIKNMKNLKNIRIQKSASVDKLIPKQVPNISEFHKKLMKENQLSCSKRLKEEYKKFQNNLRDKEKLNEMIFQRRENKKLNTGIYGPNNNIVSVLMARIQRLKLDNDYRGVDEDLKELIKDEILDAQVKLKMKPISLIGKKGPKNLLFKTKLDKYRYLSKMNLIREINHNAVTPLVVGDGHMMIKLINEAFSLDNFKIKNKI